MIAGTVNKAGYCKVWLDGRVYGLHRIAFKMMTREEPPPILDHKDGDGLNNRWLNLRPATPGQSSRNRMWFQNNTTGYRGVYRYNKQRWVAKIGIDGAHRYLGDFATAEDASAAYEMAARELFGEFYQGR